MRTKMVAGNWKMNKNFSDAEDLIFAIGESIEKLENNDVEVILCPPFLYLEMAGDCAEDFTFEIGSQNVSEWESGAYTGEISAEMLRELNVTFCIIGHSERRKYFNETSAQIAKKASLLLQNDLIPIVCCGELLEDRDANKQFEVVKQQLQESLFHLSKEDFQSVIIAYEPVWAIGTGKTASSEQAQEMHAFIRGVIAVQYGESIANEIPILYGGSCNAKNAKELFANPDVDGGLIGGASLNSEDFLAIVQSF